MARNIHQMTPKEMESVCRSMTDSFMDYEMTGTNLGMLEHLDREHFYYMTRSYLEMALRNGSLYSVGDNHEGHFVFETPDTKGSISGSLLQAKWMLKAFEEAGRITLSWDFILPLIL